MLRNLLDNAIKRAPSGSAVRVGLDRADGAYRLSVSDTGPGIPAEARDRVFDRFYRAHGTRQGSDGAGLGLAIAQWVAEAHGGTIELARSATSGSEFCVTLPDGPH